MVMGGKRYAKAMCVEPIAQVAVKTAKVNLLPLADLHRSISLEASVYPKRGRGFLVTVAINPFQRSFNSKQKSLVKGGDVGAEHGSKIPDRYRLKACHTIPESYWTRPSH